MRVLVTAGPTREPIDPVRFLSNHSSGRMGYALARALLAVGHEVVLVSGPVALRPPKGAQLELVETAQEMLSACRRLWKDCDGLIAVAAVADYRPTQCSQKKLKMQAGEGRVLELIPNSDIVQTLAAKKGGRKVVGFALESGSGHEEALRKLKAKHLDWVVLNHPEAQGARQASLTLLDAFGGVQKKGPSAKTSLARWLVQQTFPSSLE